jgi:hypothetical protein
VKSADFVSYPRGITFRSREDVSLAAGSSVPRRVLLENRRHYYGITLIGDLSFPSVWLNQRVDMRSSALFPLLLLLVWFQVVWTRLSAASVGRGSIRALSGRRKGLSRLYNSATCDLLSRARVPQKGREGRSRRRSHIASCCRHRRRDT